MGATIRASFSGQVFARYQATERGDTRQLALTQDVFKETLRLYPPIAFFLTKRRSRAAACATSR